MLARMNRRIRMPLDRSSLLPPLPNLESALAELVAQIPAGRVATCGALAEALGFRGAAVWVAQWSADHDHCDGCRCHRIVRASGEPGPFIAGPTAEKVSLLRSEGVAMAADDGAWPPRLEIDRFLFTGFQCDRPLAALVDLQNRVAALRSDQTPRQPPRRIAGFDAAYRSDGTIQAACTICDGEGALLVRNVIRRPVGFPYISSLLAFRELPAYAELLDRLQTEGHEPDLLMIDGSGTLHPRGAGIAVHLGVLAGLPSVGVSKTPLLGRCDTAGIATGHSEPIVVGGQRLGVAFRPSKSSRKCVFISPGHRCDVSFAERWVRQMTGGRRLPEPLYWADRFSRQASVD